MSSGLAIRKERLMVHWSTVTFHKGAAQNFDQNHDGSCRRNRRDEGFEHHSSLSSGCLQDLGEVGQPLSGRGSQPRVILQERYSRLSGRIAAHFRVPESKRPHLVHGGVTPKFTDSRYSDPCIVNVTLLVSQPPQDLPRCDRPIGIVPIKHQVIVYGPIDLVVCDHFLSQVLHHCVPQTADLAVEGVE